MKLVALTAENSRFRKRNRGRMGEGVFPSCLTNHTRANTPMAIVARITGESHAY